MNQKLFKEELERNHARDRKHAIVKSALLIGIVPKKWNSKFLLVIEMFS